MSTKEVESNVFKYVLRIKQSYLLPSLSCFIDTLLFFFLFLFGPVVSYAISNCYVNLLKVAKSAEAIPAPLWH